MCLSTVYTDSGGRRECAMRDVARMETKSGGFLLTNLFGETKFVDGKVRSVDFVDEHAVIIEKDVI